LNDITHKTAQPIAFAIACKTPRNDALIPHFPKMKATNNATPPTQTATYDKMLIT